MNNINNLKDHIDTPILKVVAGLNLLGLTTVMSCCGFSYKGEEVRKSHLQKPYVYLKSEDILKNSNLKELLCDLAIKSNWVFYYRGSFIDFYAEVWKDNHIWSKRESVHNYEAYILSIYALNKAILTRFSDMKDKEFVADGNRFYKDNVSSYWQYEPAEDWIISKQIYLDLPI